MGRLPNAPSLACSSASLLPLVADRSNNRGVGLVSILRPRSSSSLEWVVYPAPSFPQQQDPHGPYLRKAQRHVRLFSAAHLLN